ALRRAADAHRRVNACSADCSRDAGGEIAVADQLDARARFTNLRDQIVMAFAVPNDDRELVRAALKCLRDLIEILLHRLSTADELPGGWADDDLVHVDVGRVEQT